MGFVQCVAENELERMLARRQFQRCLGLPLAEMQVILIAGYWLGQIRQLHVHD
jgi:hypothetical protein